MSPSHSAPVTDWASLELSAFKLGSKLSLPTPHNKTFSSQELLLGILLCIMPVSATSLYSHTLLCSIGFQISLAIKTYRDASVRQPWDTCSCLNSRLETYFSRNSWLSLGPMGHVWLHDMKKRTCGDVSYCFFFTCVCCRF